MSAISLPGGSTDAASIGGVTPTAAGLALLDDANAAAQRTTLGLGTIATQADPLALASGGTAAATALAAKSGLQVTGLATDQATLTTAMVTVYYTSTQAVTLPAASGGNAGQPIRCVNASTATITLTFSRAGSDTISYASTTSATSAAISIPASSAIELSRESSSVWRVVQPSSVGTSQGLIYLSGGVWYGVGQGLDSSGTAVATRTPVALTALRADAYITLSGANISVLTSAPSVARADLCSGVWYIALSDLGLSAASRFSVVTAYASATTLPTANYAVCGVALLSAAWATNAQTVNAVAWAYETTRIARYCAGNGSLASIASANTERLVAFCPSFGGTGGTVAGRLANNSAGAGPFAAAGTSAQITHIGIFAGAVGTPVADSTWVAPQFVITVAGN